MTEDEGKTKPSWWHKLVGPRMAECWDRGCKPGPRVHSTGFQKEGKGSWLDVSVARKKKTIFSNRTHQCSTALTLIVSK